MFLFIEIFHFFKLTTQKPEISRQPHLLKDLKLPIKSQNPQLKKFCTVKNIEFIVDFKNEFIFENYSTCLLYQNYEIISLVAYDIIKEDSHFKLSNEKKDSTFKFIWGCNYFIYGLREDYINQVFSLIPFNNNFPEKIFYNYISKTKGKAWKVIVNLINCNSKFTCKLET